MQNDSQFNPINELKESWQVFRDNWLSLSVVYFLRCWIPLVVACITFALLIDFKGWNLLAFVLASLATTSFLLVPYLKFFKTISLKRKENWKDLRIDFKKGLYSLLTTIFATLAVVSGLVLLIVPGIILAVRLSLSWICVVDGKSPIESINTSFKMTAGLFLPILLIFVVVGLLDYLTAIFALILEFVITIFFCRLYAARSGATER
ncbi:MAG: hypothetical protein KIT34_02050 [Cyanobacteria bacterium TGS_CYA1]|nr:hypothetical protein [Cyanobacteria bacterium TGS_CYA1]